MSLSLNYPTISPSLLLDFVNSNRVDPLVTFTRSSAATYFDETGTLQTAGNNVPRVDFDPSTLVCRGLLVEEQRTNSIRNNTMQGAVAGTPGTAPTNWSLSTSANGLTREIIGVGTESGITYIDVKYSGTATATAAATIASESTSGIAASTGQAWSSSVYLRLVGGSLPAGGVQITLQEFDSGSNFLRSSDVPVSVTATLSRFSQTVTMGASTAFVRPVVFFGYTNGAAIDITLRIGLPQLELGAFATSVIPTTTTAVTRAADVASVNTLSPWFNAAEGTLFVQGILVGGTAATFPHQAALVGSNANTDSIGIVWTANAGPMRFGARVGASGQADLNAGSNKTAGSSYKVAGRYAANNFQMAADGTLSTPDTSGSLPTIVALSLGGAVSFQPIANVWLQRVTYYPRIFADAQLQALTA